MPGSIRRLVFGTAFLLALVVCVLPRTPVAHAQDARPAAPAPAAAPAVPAPPAPPALPGKAASKDGKTKSSVTAKIDVSTDKSGNSTVTIEKSGADAVDDTADSETIPVQSSASGLASTARSTSTSASSATSANTTRSATSSTPTRPLRPWSS